MPAATQRWWPRRCTTAGSALPRSAGRPFQGRRRGAESPALLEAGWWRGRVDTVKQPREHHLFPRLIAPPDFLGGVGVRLVVRGVVVPRRGVERRALRQLHRALENVVGLPLEVVLRDRQERFLAAIRIRRFVAPSFP